ncbi:MAG: class I SAM-dependent DNA methyltransferase [Actinobacteria bacterium]|nr:class I SAM-dependent DNA methyltransferase [Actinomycetota bacterium]
MTTATQNDPPAVLRQRLQTFVEYRQNHLHGDEKGEAQVFLDRLFQALGYAGVAEAGATLEYRLRRQGKAVSFADLLWKPRVLIEMKKRGEDLSRHYQQALRYWIDAVPNRPQFVVLCNFDFLWIYDFERQLDEPVDRVPLVDLPRRWEAMAFLLPEPEEPQFGNDLVAVTRTSAARAARLSNELLARGLPREQVRRFLLQCIMAMFSEDIGLLPTHSFTRAVSDCANGEKAFDLLFSQFREMNTIGVTSGGRFKGTPYFNGGLYSQIEPFELTRNEVDVLAEVSQTDWGQVRPEIFGTLFEQSMGKDERHAFGAHYTSPVDIARIVEPTIVQPINDRIEQAWDSIPELEKILLEMSQLRILDPACGCGNFLYIAYREMRRLERRVTARIEERRRGRGKRGIFGLSLISADHFHGIDINPFAVEIAKVTLMIAKQLSAQELDDDQQVLPLENLDGNFTVGDALFMEWPKFDACIGNPPYLGRRRIIEERGAAYSAQLAERFPNVSGVSDYVSYWFQLAHDKMPDAGRAGLVGTNSIREGSSRSASLDYILDNGGVITDAVSSLKWDGDAKVNVSIVNWAKSDSGKPKVLWLDEAKRRILTPEINSALSAALDLRAAGKIDANIEPKRCFQGQTPGHRGFVIEDASVAADLSVAGSAVIHPFMTGDDLNDSGRPARWIIDFPHEDAGLARAANAPAFSLIKETVLRDREDKARFEEEANTGILKRNPRARVNWHHRNFLNKWWQLSYRRSALMDALGSETRYLALSRYAVSDRPSIYAFVDPMIHPADKMMAFLFDDEYSFGVLSSSLHRLWFEHRCTTLGQAVSYTSRTVFDTFPWPQQPTQGVIEDIVSIAVKIMEHRQARNDAGLSLGQQYDALRVPGKNILRDLHMRLDAAVMRAYGLNASDDPLAGLLSLNLALTEPGRSTAALPPGGGHVGVVAQTAHRIMA